MGQQERRCVGGELERDEDLVFWRQRRGGSVRGVSLYNYIALSQYTRCKDEYSVLMQAATEAAQKNNFELFSGVMELGLELDQDPNSDQFVSLLQTPAVVKFLSSIFFLQFRNFICSVSPLKHFEISSQAVPHNFIFTITS